MVKILVVIVYQFLWLWFRRERGIVVRVCRQTWV